MLKRVVQIKKLDADWMHSEFYPAASDAEIADFEQRMQIAIPESYKAFLRIANGAARECGGRVQISGFCGAVALIPTPASLPSKKTR